MCAGASAGGGGAAGLATNLFTVFLMRPTPGGNTEIKTDERCATLLAQTQTRREADAEPHDNCGLGCREVAGAKWMDCDEYLEQSTSRMPPGGVYYTLNELAIAAFDGPPRPHFNYFS